MSLMQATPSSDGSTLVRRRGIHAAALLALGMIALATAASPASASNPPLTGTCGCSTPIPATCNSLHDCTVPRYVCDRNAAAFPGGPPSAHGTRANNRVDCTINFPVAAGKQYLLDGDGNLLTWNNAGTPTAVEVAVPTVRINYGTRRILYGFPAEMAFSVPGSDGQNHTGWILDRAINEDMSWMPVETPATPSNPALVALPIHAAVNRSYYLTSDGVTSLKVTTDCNAGGQRATDYLDKNGLVDQEYNTPGWGAGSSAMDVVGMGDVFYRDANIPHVAVPLYDCRSGTPINVNKSLWFLYGAVNTTVKHPTVGQYPARFGWMAYPVIQ